MGNGKKLQEIIKDKNYTVTKLAEETGISVNTLYAIIKRDSNITSTTLNKIADAWQISVDELSDLLSEAEISEAAQEEPYVMDPDTLLSDVQSIIKKLNDLSKQYNQKIREANEIRNRIAFLGKQQEAITAEKETLGMRLQSLDNDIKNMSVDLELIRNRLK